MKLLLDTRAFLWCVGNDRRLRVAVRNAVVDPANRVMVSAVVAWEIAIKAALGRPTLTAEQVERGIRESGFVELPISVRHAGVAAALPLLHRDPFDRMLVAQAQAEGATLVTHDKTMKRYDTPMMWT